MINHDKKYIFLHLPKTAGSSIKKVLLKGEEGKNTEHTVGHPHLWEYKNNLGGNGLGNYFKFAITRNPFDRLVSSFFYISADSQWIPDIRMRKQFNLENSSFSFFVKNTLKLILKDPSLRPRHFKPQADFFYGDQTNCPLDLVGKFENLQEDFNTVCDRIGIPKQKLPHENKSKHKHYTEYYDDETRQIVAERYAKDIEHFGYRFGE